MSQWDMCAKPPVSPFVDLMDHVRAQAQNQGRVPVHHLSHLVRINAYLAQMGHAQPPRLIQQREDVGMFHHRTPTQD